MTWKLSAVAGVGALLAFGAPAQADVSITPYTVGSVTLDGGTTPVGSPADALETRTGGIKYKNEVRSDSAGVSFESGAIGYGSAASQFTSGVDVTITNTTGAAFDPVLKSSIIPAGLGLWIADIEAPCSFDGCPYGFGPSFRTVTPTDGNVLASGGVFATALFDFSVTSQGVELKRLTGSFDFVWDASSDQVTVVSNLGAAAAELLGFRQFSMPDVIGVYAFAWDATPFEVTGASLADGESRTFEYRATVSTFSAMSPPSGWGAFIFSGFGDPIGRPGAGCCASFQAVGFEPASFAVEDGKGVATLALSNPAIPEPQVWAMMIGGFGLVGGALRRRAHARVA